MYTGYKTCLEERNMSAKDIIKKSILESAVFNQIDFTKLVLGLVAALIMGIIIYCVYSKCYRGVIYSQSFAMTLIGMSVLTCMVTLAISTNLVISLGLVGALSIVRFRTAIKDPLDLLYLFWSITSGITAGAGMYLIMGLSGLIMIVMIAIFSRRQNSGKIFVAIIHYSGDCEDKVLQCFGRTRYQVKSKTIRGGKTELAVEVFCKKGSPAFGYAIGQVEGVEDVNLIQYNGEYHG